MKQPPAVSILLPFYQAADTLPAALASIRRQTFEDWECVLVDDGSADGGAELAQEAARHDQRFRPMTLPHGGLVAALNAGIDRCRASLVARMDADDVMHRDRLVMQIAALEREPDLAGVGCHVRIFPRRGLSAGLRDYEDWLNAVADAEAVRREAFVESPLVHPTLMFRRDVLSRFRYRDAGWPEDYDLLLRLLGGGCRLGVVPRRLLLWRDSPERLTRTGDVYQLERLTACKAAFLAADFLRGESRYVLWGYGETGRSLRKALLAEGRSPAYVVELHPRRLGQRVEGVPFVPPEDLTALPRLPLIASVAGARPRGEIRAFLTARGFVEGRDFVCAA